MADPDQGQELQHQPVTFALRAPVSPRLLAVTPERAAWLQRVAFALQVLHGYLLLLAPRRPRL